MGTYSAIPRAAYREQPRRMPRCLGFERYALGFNGSSNYVEVTGSASLTFGDGEEWSLEMWITPQEEIWCSLGGSKNYDEGDIMLHNGKYVYYRPPGVPYDGKYWWSVNIGSFLNQTLYLLITMDSSRIMRAYRNGNYKGETTPENSAIIFNSLAYAYHSEYGKVVIYQARIYNRVLAEEEAKWNMLNYHNPVRDGLVLWLPMEEGSGLTVYDKSGHGNNGSLLPADDPPTWERVRQWELRQVV